MTEIIGVRFRDNEKMCYLDPQGEKYFKDQFVVVKIKKGSRCGKVVLENTNVRSDLIASPISKVIRIADSDDIIKMKQILKREKESAKVFKKKAEKHKLGMKLIDVECIFSTNKLVFYFTADGRVDFRAFVKDLASSLHAKIELKQIGSRDEARMIGGLGFCGKPFCCSTFLDDFHSVSIKMAKEQNLSLSPSKISGTCGKLMCCLKFEQAAYADLIKKVPKVGSVVKTSGGLGKVIDNNLLTGVLHVQLIDNLDAAPIKVNAQDVEVVKLENKKN